MCTSHKYSRRVVALEAQTVMRLFLTVGRDMYAAYRACVPPAVGSRWGGLKFAVKAELKLHSAFGSESFVKVGPHLRK